MRPFGGSKTRERYGRNLSRIEAQFYKGPMRDQESQGRIQATRKTDDCLAATDGPKAARKAGSLDAWLRKKGGPVSAFYVFCALALAGVLAALRTAQL